jgi:hypothetical protein
MFLGGWVDGWMGGWMGGCKSRFKDCLQQSKNYIFGPTEPTFLQKQYLFSEKH